MNIEEIYKFLIEFQGVKRNILTPDSDLLNDLDIDGDDFFELEEEFMSKFNVNMDSYRWYFHHGEEGFNFGSIFAPAPYQQVEHIPVTPRVLLEAAQTKVWPIIYPEHTITSRRKENAINKSIFFLLIGFVFLCLLKIA
jgi:acyl carrier protein